ncbi:MAG: sugar phosphate isomerase/epimerase [Clostridiales bacterium]|nr:sugar phosphate isomerase/epimerase [Clostridiales bacterium]
MIRKGVNMWTFPAGTSVREAIRQAKEAGFDGIELAFTVDGELSEKTGEAEIRAIKAYAEDLGIEIGGLASAQYWNYTLSSNYESLRNKTKEFIKRHLETAALLGVKCILVVGPNGGPDTGENPDCPKKGEFRDYETAYQRALDGLLELAPYAQAQGVAIGLENVWNAMFLSPLEMRNFIDKVNSPFVGAYLDVGNMMLFSYPEQWIRVLGNRILMVHFKDFRRSVGNFDGFVDLLEGDVNFPACMAEFEAIGYDGWAFAELGHYQTHPELTARFASIAMDKILGR